MNTLLDPALGPPGQQGSAAITGICGDALHAVLGPGLAQAALADPELLTRIAPWARDLARGLQYRDRYGAADPPTIALITRLAGRLVPEGQARRLAETVDLAVALTLGRVTDQALGPAPVPATRPSTTSPRPGCPRSSSATGSAWYWRSCGYQTRDLNPWSSAARRRAVRQLVLTYWAGSS
ncbi:MAG TPA: hypothetical protein VF070_48895 [Streptosporangiaceae bacterium]